MQYDEFLNKYYDKNAQDYLDLNRKQFVEQHRALVKLVDTLANQAIEEHFTPPPNLKPPYTF